jgi:uroporphyrinogen III methyltransferase/synthase
MGRSEVVDVREESSHEIRPLEPGDDAFASPARLCAFTSQVSVERMTGDPNLRARFERAVRGARLAAVGTATAGALRDRGFEPDLIAGGSVDSLLAELPDRLDGWTVLLPCGEDASQDLPEELHRRGAHVNRAVVYRKVPLPRDVALAREIVDDPFAAFCTTSPAAAEWLFVGLDPGSAERLRHTPAVVLGRFTRRCLEAHGVERIAIAEDASFDGALRLLEHLASEFDAA